MSVEYDRRGALEAVDRILNRGGDADDVLRGVLAVLRERASVDWAGIAFVEEGRLELGPSVGGEPPAAWDRREIAFRGRPVAELRSAGGDAAVLDRVALVISPFCLVGWDTGGRSWEP